MQDRVTIAQVEAKFRHASGQRSMPDGWTPVGVWVRVSSGAQDEANQVPAVIDHCISRRYWPVRWYIVHSKSAYHGGHQADLDRAVMDMREGLTRVLVIWHSDRLERRHDHGKSQTLFNTLAEFTDAGGTVESTQEPTLGQLDFGGQLLTFTTGLMNHEKSKHISEQVKLALERAKANQAIYSKVPWGWTIVGQKYSKTIVPTEECRTYIPEIYKRCIKGDSLRTIAAWLDSEGVKPTSGDKWDESVIRRMIRNRIYAGRYVTRRVEDRTVLRCEEIVRPEIFDRANDALKHREKRGKSSQNPPLLAKLKCPRCGSPMYRVRCGRKVIRYYYRCFGSGPQRKGCGNMVHIPEVDALVISHFSSSERPFKTRRWVEGKNWDSEISDVNQDLRELMNDILADDALERIAERKAELVRLTELNDNRQTGKWAYTEVLNEDGSVRTEGEHFRGLSDEARREYLEGRDIRALKIKGAGFLVTVDAPDDGLIEDGTIYLYDSLGNRAPRNEPGGRGIDRASV